MKIPVLLLVYNRPKETQNILRHLENLNVKNLFISLDGPKNNKKDKVLNSQIQKTIKLFKIKNKKIKINSFKKNYGCKIAVEKGINWFFTKVDRGIILEDDCLPTKSFFLFCKMMLKKYENTKVKVISGNNFLKKKIKINDHYYFSNFNHCWGWATWKVAWSSYDRSLKNWKTFKKTNKWKFFFDNEIDKKYWEKIFDLCQTNYFDSWAYPWLFSIWYNNGCTIIPKYNLVKNIGLKGTHNSFYTKFDFNVKNLEPNFKHPKKININKRADNFVMKNFFKPNNFLWPTRFFYLLKMFVLQPFIFTNIAMKKINKYVFN